MKTKFVLGSLVLATAFTAQAQVMTVISGVSSVISIVRMGKDILGGNPEYLVKIRSTDVNQKSARDLGFRESCNRAIGSVIASETESSNQRLERDNITNYSSCYVKKYQITNVQESGGLVTVEMEVVVSPNKVANRLLGESTVNDASLDADQHSARIDTFRESKQDGDKLLNSVLSDYPKRAWDLKITGTKTSVDQYRNSAIHIHYEAKISENYIDSFNDVLKSLGKVAPLKVMGAYPLGHDENIPRIKLIGSGKIINWNETYQIHDRVTYDNIRNKLSNQISVIMYVKMNSGPWKTMECWNMNWGQNSNIMGIGHTSGYVSSIKTLSGYFILPVNNTRNLSQVTDTRFVVTDQGCNNT